MGATRSAAVAVAAAAAVLPLVVTGPAEAITYYGCTVEALKPTVEPGLNKAGRKVIRYPWTTSCAYGDYSLNVWVRFMEYDDGKIGDGGWKDDQVGEKKFRSLVSPKGKLEKWAWKLPLADTDNYHVEEVYSAISFRLCSVTDPTACYTGWSNLEKSPLLRVHYS